MLAICLLMRKACVQCVPDQKVCRSALSSLPLARLGRGAVRADARAGSTARALGGEPAGIRNAYFLGVSSVKKSDATVSSSKRGDK